VAARTVKQVSENINMPSEQPVVTVALPVYNGASTLAIAIRSILNQSFGNWELIILNDASTDDSLRVMRSFDDPRIRLVEGDTNIGLSARLNMAVNMAKGIYFARMDQDDISLPLRLEKQLDYLHMHPEVDLLASNYAVFNDNLEWLGKLSVAQQHDEICRKPWSGFYMPHPTWMGKLEWFIIVIIAMLMGLKIRTCYYAVMQTVILPAWMKCCWLIDRMNAR